MALTLQSMPLVDRKKTSAVTAGGEDDGMGGVAFDFTGDQVPDHDTPGLAVHQHQVQHFPAGKHGDPARGHLAHQGAICPQQQLLAGLPPGIKRPGYLGTAEGAVGQQAAVLPGKGNALGHTLVDDRFAHLGQAVDIAFPGPEIAAFDGVIKEPPDAVAVIGIILGRIDAALGRDAVSPAGAVLDTESLDVVAQLRQGGRSGSAGQAGAHDDNVKFSFVGRVDQLQFERCDPISPGGRPESWHQVA